MNQRKPTRQWRRWHRWLGLAVALPVLVLSVTGVLLNHIDSFGWSSRPLPPLLARWYGAPVPDAVSAISLQGRWYAQANDSLFIDGEKNLYCQAPLRGVVQENGWTVVGCADELLLLDTQGQQVERMGPAYGVPAFSGMGRNDRGLVLKTEQGLLQYNVDQLASVALPDDAAWIASRQQPLPDTMKQRIVAQSVPPSLNWQRLLLDLHAGRLFGLAGQLVMDLAALVLVILALTGTVIWSRSRR